LCGAMLVRQGAVTCKCSAGICLTSRAAADGVCGPLLLGKGQLPDHSMVSRCDARQDSAMQQQGLQGNSADHSNRLVSRISKTVIYHQLLCNLPVASSSSCCSVLQRLFLLWVTPQQVGEQVGGGGRLVSMICLIQELLLAPGWGCGCGVVCCSQVGPCCVDHSL
jgi:hypothetical protein